MAKLTREERKQHDIALKLLEKDQLTLDEAETVLRNYHPSHSFDVGASGAFFTPFDLAGDFRIDAGSGRIIDLCAGIGGLGFWCLNYPWFHQEEIDLVCVEINPTFVEIGKKILPQATWICADVFDVQSLDLGHFDKAIANPPFGRVNRHGRAAPRYSGNDFAYHVMDIASDIADHGAFIVPQGSTAPFQYSGVQCYRRTEGRAYKAFLEQTGIGLEAGCGIDTSQFRDDWKGVSPAVEIVCADFMEAREQRQPAQHDLFKAIAA